MDTDSGGGREDYMSHEIRCNKCGGQAYKQDEDGRKMVYCTTCGDKQLLKEYNRKI